jgi:hypothetical protein
VHPQRLRGDDQPFVVQPGHQLRPSLILPPHQALRRNPAVGEVQVVDLTPAHRLDGANVEAVDVGGHGDHRQALVFVGRAVGAADQQHMISDVRACDPCLLAVDDVAAVRALSPAGEVADVRSGLGF